MPLSSIEIATAGGLVATAAAGTWLYAGLAPGPQLFGRTLVAPAQPGELALTFDDGPNPAATPQLLDVLARANARATFFLIGSYVRREPVLTRAIAAAGHLIGNHTWSHPRLLLQPAAEIRRQLADCNAALEDTLGQSVRFFRPPHGSRRPAVLQAARELGMQTVQWNLIAGDWKPQTPAGLHDRIARGIGRNRSRARGTCLVLHDGGQHGLNQPRLPTVQAVALLLAPLPAHTRLVTPEDWTQGAWSIPSGPPRRPK